MAVHGAQVDDLPGGVAALGVGGQHEGLSVDGAHQGGANAHAQHGHTVLLIGRCQAAADVGQHKDGTVEEAVPGGRRGVSGEGDEVSDGKKIR